MLYFKAMENGEAWSSGVDELFTSLTTHLTDEDCKFFSKWHRLSMLEASYNAAHSKSRYLWRESSEEREKHGYCFSGMQMIREDETSDEKIHYVFQRKDNHSNFGTSLKSIPLVVGTRVIISEEKCGVFNITTGSYYLLGQEKATLVLIFACVFFSRIFFSIITFVLFEIFYISLRYI